MTMIRALLRAIVVVVLLVAAAAFFFGYRWGGSMTGPRSPESAGTSGSSPDERTERAREAGAKVGERVAEGAARADTLLDEARLTAKVKSKMTLDDTLKGTDVSVQTSGTTVTLEGHVSTAAQRRRVVQLARETDGVTDVIDRLVVEPPRR